jgi:hypothetical protein
MTPEEALRHEWILDGLPPKVLIHHQRLHNLQTTDLPKKFQAIILKEEQKAALQGSAGNSGSHVGNGGVHSVNATGNFNFTSNGSIVVH